MFISPAFAQGAEGGSQVMAFLPIILIFVVFYFLLIRPQQKRAKVHREMLGAISRGDKIVTNGGILGTVTKVLNDTELAVEIAEGVKVRVQRGMISQVVTRAGGTPAGGQAAPQQPAQGGGLLGKLMGGGKSN